MRLAFFRSMLFGGLFAMVLAIPAQAKPLKVYILCGQSNMEGHAQTRTFPAVQVDPATQGLYKDMVDAQGKPVVCSDVWMAYSYGDFGGNPVGTKTGNLTAGWGSQHHVGTGKIGPEFTFGIYTQKRLNEPILIIKTAWGGKSLMTDFRPPSAGELPDTAKQNDKDKAGRYYQLTIDYVKQVLNDPKSACPAYDPEEGFELAGFVWFQGFNDLVGPYPRADASNKKSAKDYSEYSRLLACLIRDVRKDLDAPALPFVIGVLGVGGETDNPGTLAFRQAMATPAEMDEFKGNVANVWTHKYWPTEIDVIKAKVAPIQAEQKKRSKQLSDQGLDSDQLKKEQAKLAAEIRAQIEQALTKQELFLLDNGISNQGFHYHGSAKFFAQTGKAFADALAEMK